MSKRQVYMDNNATTPLHPEVKKAMFEALSNFGNPSSLHTFGREARSEVEKARQILADFIEAVPEEIVFVGSGSEANNTILNLLGCTSSECKHLGVCGKAIVTTTIEHPCVLETAKCLQSKGAAVYYINVDKYGKVDLEELAEILRIKKVGLVSIMMANNEIGTVQNIKKMGEIVHNYGALFHTDAVQAAGKIPVDVKELGVDFLSISAHKIYGPKGIGALFVKKNVAFCPLIRGGHQEKGRRAGTENTVGIIGFGKAAEMAKIEMTSAVQRLNYLKNKLKKGIEENIPDTYFNGHPVDSLPGTLNISFWGAEGESILLYLDLEGIAVSTGSACASGSLDPSHVLLATGIDVTLAHGSIRFSLGRENTEEDVDYVLDVLPNIIKKIRELSTVYMKSKK